METITTSKRSYHPLVVYFYHNNLLNAQQLAFIPPTTIAYWNKNKPYLMFGFDWVKGFSADYEDFTKIQKRKIIYKAAKLCIKTLECLSSVLDKVKNIKGLMKENARLIVETIDYLLTEMPIQKACRVFKISSSQYYRWKNKVHCSASVLNLCFKTYPHQLTIAEASVIKEAVNQPAYKYLPRVSIYYTLLNAARLFCSLTTFYKYARMLFTGEKLKRPKENNI